MQNPTFSAILAASLASVVCCHELQSQSSFRPFGKAPWADGAEIAVVQRARGRHLAFSLHRFEGGAVEIPKIARGDSAQPVTLFFVDGIRSLEGFERFLTQPSSRSWASATLRGSGGVVRLRSFVTPAKSELFAHGRVTGFDGKAVSALELRTWKVGASPRKRLFLSRAYDPCTSRFWVQASPVRPGAHDDEALDTVLLDFVPLPVGGVGQPAREYAVLRGLAFARGEERAVRLAEPASLRAEFLKLSVAGGFHAVLRSSVGAVSISRPFTGGDVIFAGLASGEYRLDLEYCGRVIKSWKGLKLEAGQALEPEPFDVSDVVVEAEIEVEGNYEHLILERVLSVDGRFASFAEVYRSGDPILMPRAGGPLLLRANSKKIGARVFERVDGPTRVVLEAAKRVRVKFDLAELRADASLLRDLYVRMQPAESPYPDWAWSCFLLRSRARRRGDATLATAHAAVRAKDRHVELLVPFAGKWRLEWAYMRPRRSQAVSNPFVDEVEIVEDGQELSLELPLSQLRKAFAHFVVERKKR